MMGKKATIKDVARFSGVSIATVSLVLNGNAHKFSPATVAKVIEAKKELNYSPNYFAQRMVIKGSKTIGVMLSDIANPFFGQLMTGVEKALYQENFVTVLCNANFDMTKEHDYLEELMRRGVDGFIIATPVISNKALCEMLHGNNHPFIVIDQNRTEGAIDSVVSDDFEGGRLAAEHLLGLGHKQLAIVMPVEGPENLQNRLRGFRAACKNQVETVTILDTSMNKSGGYAVAKQVVETKATGVFAINDETAFGLYRGLEDLGKSIPEDYSVIGYDDVEMCEYVTPRLTTIAQPIEELGEAAAQLLMKRIKEPDKEAEDISLPVTLIERHSTRVLSGK
ncbi:ribose utilization transcriptional repressor RbsR [Candidatus Enterococcus ferrettii]|nr:LacI family DNA-binding transcriptional regulator [Enterococcus sp. 665A]